MKGTFLWAALIAAFGIALLVVHPAQALTGDRVGAGPAHATEGNSSKAALDQKPTPSDDQVNAIAHQLYCPVCENIPLDVCPTQACAQWRDLIRQKLSAGWSEQQIKDYFVVQYGDRVLAVPPQRGLNWMVYILPPVIILGGAVLLYVVLRRMRASASTTATGLPGLSTHPPASPSAPVDDYVRRLEEELRKRER